MHHFLASINSEQVLLLGLAGIVVLGICAQWIAWRIRIPAILLLLAAGIGVGPVWQMIFGHKLLDPDKLLGPLLQPLVSLSVAIILFEGGLTLNLSDLRHSGQVLWRLVTLGVVVRWFVGSIAAVYVLGFSWRPAVLLGAILVVTGPTVIGPLLRFVRPTGDVGTLLKWEGIVIDPIGATLALLVFATIIAGGGGSVTHVALVTLARTVGFGSLIGFSAAALLIWMLRRFWVADQLQVPMALMLVIAAFVGSNLLQSESGLLAVTVMGVVLTNQKFAPISHIWEFKESLTVLLIGSLFILLGSRLEVAQITAINWRTLICLLILLFISRPLSVWISTIGTKLPRNERIFMAWMAPRGIVAAAVSSVFALQLREMQIPNAAQIVPITFAVIVGTVSVYGLSAPWLARKLGLSNPGNRGVLIAGANPLARQIAQSLQEAGQDVLLVDTNRSNIAAARMEGLPTFQGNILSEQLLRRIEGTCIGRLFALTPNADLNSLAIVHFARHFGRSQVFQLPRAVDAKIKADVTHELHGRLLFDPELNYDALHRRLDGGDVLKKTRLTEEFSFEQLNVAGNVKVCFVVDPSGELNVSTVANPIVPKAGQAVVALTPHA